MVLVGALSDPPDLWEPKIMDLQIEPLATETAEPVHSIELLFRRADGRNAANAFVALLSPELTSGRTDSAGRVKLHFLQKMPSPEDECVLMAQLAEHEVLSLAGPWSELPSEYQFSLLEKPQIEPGRLATVQTRRWRLLDQYQEPLVGALALAWRPDEQNMAARKSMSTDLGLLELEGCLAGPMHVRIFAPGLPPQPAWLLTEDDLEAEDGLGPLQDRKLAVVHLRLRGFPAGSLISLSRLDVQGTYPWIRVQDDGRYSFRPLPAGRYRLEVNNRRQELNLEPGSPEILFTDF